jgi:hypothetical protein
MEKEYYDKKFAEIPQEVLDKALTIINSELDDQTKQWAKDLFILKGPIEWAISLHHGWGTAIRNMLRTTGGLSDNLLPDKNWDDYYIQVIEAAIGVR